ncbi:MAG: tyrosine-type recombinase/integrase, partial [bacterium]|nr:tyrosine-type recombinase/integrase [bacterium]
MDLKHMKNQFIDYVRQERGLARNTIEATSSDLVQFIAFLQAKRLSPKTVSAFSQFLYDRGFKANSISRKLSSVQQFCRFLYREGSISWEPETLGSSPKQERYLPHVIHKDDMAHLLNSPCALDKYPFRDKAILELCYACGLRISELPNLTLNRIRGQRLSVIGKGNKERLVPIGKQAKLALDNYLANERGQLAREWTGDTLFLSSRGKALTRAAMHSIITKYVSRAGLPDTITPHAIRHTFATDLMNGGAGLRVVQQLLGHESITTTQRYTHVSTSELKKQFLA